MSSIIMFAPYFLKIRLFFKNPEKENMRTHRQAERTRGPHEPKRLFVRMGNKINVHFVAVAIPNCNFL